MTKKAGQKSELTSSEAFKFFLNFGIILTALFVVNLTTLMLVSDEYYDENSLLPLQAFETRIVYDLQKAMGYDVELQYSDKNVGVDHRIIVEYDGDLNGTLTYNAWEYTIETPIDRNVTVFTHQLVVDVRKSDGGSGNMTVTVMRGGRVIHHGFTGASGGRLEFTVEVDNKEYLDEPTLLHYPDMEGNGEMSQGIEITGICAGLREMAVIATLVLLVGGVRWRLKFKWAGILVGLIFLENLLRIFLIHPLSLAYGWDFAWNQFHQFFWEVGQRLEPVPPVLLGGGTVDIDNGAVPPLVRVRRDARPRPAGVGRTQHQVPEAPARPEAPSPPAQAVLNVHRNSEGSTVRH